MTESLEDKRNKFRRIAKNQTKLQVPSYQADLYAAFMAEREEERGKEFPNRVAVKWADRFKERVHFHASDKEKQKRLLRLMTENIDGTAPAIRSEYIREVFVEMLQDQDDNVRVSVVEEIAEELGLDVTVEVEE